MPERDESTGFERELTLYNEKREELLRTAPGQFVAIYADKLIGPYSSYTGAYTEAVRTFGNVRVFIKQVLPDEPVTFSPSFSISRAKANFTCRYSP